MTPSTSEADTNACRVVVADGSKEAIFIKHVCIFLLREVEIPRIEVFEDNQGAISLASNQVSNSNAKHDDVSHQLLRELVR